MHFYFEMMLRITIDLVELKDSWCSVTRCLLNFDKLLIYIKTKCLKVQNYETYDDIFKSLKSLSYLSWSPFLSLVLYLLHKFFQ